MQPPSEDQLAVVRRAAEGGAFADLVATLRPTAWVYRFRVLNGVFSELTGAPFDLDLCDYDAFRAPLWELLFGYEG